MADPVRPAVLVRSGGELALSGEALTTLMRAVLVEGRHFRFRAKGFSMSPFIKEGDIVTVSPLAGRKLRAGTVVAFLHPVTGKAAVHRIVRAGRDGYLLRGDNAWAADGRLPPDRILGRVTEIERDGRSRRRLSGRLPAALALLSRTGGLVRGLGWLRRLKGRAGRRTA